MVIFSAGHERLVLLECGFKKTNEPQECWVHEQTGFKIRRHDWMDDETWTQIMQEAPGAISRLDY